MKDFEKIVKGLEMCTHENEDGCEECPYCKHYDDLEKDALACMAKAYTESLGECELI